MVFVFHHINKANFFKMFSLPSYAAISTQNKSDLTVYKSFQNIIMNCLPHKQTAYCPNNKEHPVASHKPSLQEELPLDLMIPPHTPIDPKTPLAQGNFLFLAVFLSPLSLWLLAKSIIFQACASCTLVSIATGTRCCPDVVPSYFFSLLALSADAQGQNLDIC